MEILIQILVALSFLLVYVAIGLVAMRAFNKKLDRKSEEFRYDPIGWISYEVYYFRMEEDVFFDVVFWPIALLVNYFGAFPPRKPKWKTKIEAWVRSFVVRPNE